MTLHQALSLCDALEELTRKGRKFPVDSCVRLKRIEQLFAAAPEADSYLLSKVSAAVDQIREFLEASQAHIRLGALARTALKDLSRLRSAVLLCYGEPATLPPIELPALHAA